MKSHHDYYHYNNCDLDSSFFSKSNTEYFESQNSNSTVSLLGFSFNIDKHILQ